ncbi:polysaccharide deacetylase family protein [Oceanobacillus sp. CAU 1775]
MYNDDERPWLFSERSSVNFSQRQLEGGPESIGRMPNLVSNAILQREYPNTVVIRGSLNSNEIALTFDDGPDPRFTPQILDILNTYQAKATFFLLGARAAVHSDIVRRINAEGHAIGNHTYWHPNLTEESIERARWEITTAEEAIEQIVGYRPRLFRPPYGALNREIVELSEQLGNAVILWNVDSLDWTQPGADMISDIIMANTAPGSIILMHDGGDWTLDLSGTVNSLHDFIPRLQAEGMKFVTVPELIGISKEK